MKFDELNKLFGAYFKVMDISEEDRKKRIDYAFLFYEAVWYVLTMIRLENERNRLDDKESYRVSLEYRIKDIIEDTPVDEEYIENITEDIIDTTFRHLDDEYFLSERRAVLIAQNEANTVMNGADFFNAKKSGKTHKQWIAQLDEKTREWHLLIDGTFIPIDEKFKVGGEEMRFPHDPTASPENLVNCRCTCIYS
jgi:uncharacterized protein with gpF-like domain